MIRFLLAGLTALTIVLAGCRTVPAGPTPIPAPSTTPVPLPAIPTTKPAERATATGAPPATATQAATTAAAVGAEPLFAIAPDDRSVFVAGLTSAGREALDESAGAPVYHMAIEIDDSMTRVSGRQTVFYTNRETESLNEIYFHLHPDLLDGAIAVTGVTVGGAPVGPEIADSMMRLPLAAPLAPGDQVEIDMRFVTDVPTDIGRNYGVLAYYDDILALAHFYPMLSVYDDEGWNIVPADVQGDLTYSDAAFYLVRVTAPAGKTLVGSGTVIAQERDGAVQTLTFAAGPARDFYLAAGEFEAQSRAVGETTITSYAPAEMVEGSALALDTAAAALAYHSETLAAYPFIELDIVTTPTSALGIEYPGAIVGRLEMYDVDGTTANGIPWSIILVSTTAHEVGHQWFYNLVGNDQLDEPWLDEALTQYITYRFYLDQYGPSSAEGYFNALEDRWLRVNREPIPIGLPVASYEGPEYGAIVYGRGPVFIRTLEEAMGREVFDAFLRDYVARNSWGQGTTAEFQALAEEHCACALGELFAEWVYE